jgi:hypothetical protein
MFTRHNRILDLPRRRTAYLLLELHANELIAKAVEMAKNDDTTALRICIDRLIPPAKAREEPVNLPLDSRSLAEKRHALLAALGDGTTSSDWRRLSV